MTNFVFYGVAALALGSWLLAVMEMIGTAFFWRWVFTFGPRVFSDERASTRHLEVPGTRFTTRSAAFLAVSSSELLFRPKLFRIHSSLFKGTLTLRGAHAAAEARVSLGLVLFLLVWLAGWSYGSFMLITRPDDVRNDTGIPAPLFALAGYAFVAAMLWFFVGLARRVARRAVEEFAQRATT